MNVLVLNCGSSSVKFRMLDMRKGELLGMGLVERIGSSTGAVRFTRQDGREMRQVQEILDHEAAISLALSTLHHQEYGVIRDRSDIDAIGHRVVHGGESFTGSVVITPEVKNSIREFARFAPLHNPHNLRGIEVGQRLVPNAPQVAVFDTAFHSSMPPSAYLYALPYSLYKRLGIRRYGFHGTSHRYVSHRAAEVIGRPLPELKLITCHLGNGASIAAVKDGRSIDTSMGFTPLEGLVMGTRCGDIDPAIVPYLMDHDSMTWLEVDDLMNRRSGLLGITGTSNDMREVIREAEKGSARHRLAIDIFCGRVKKYVGAYTAELGGIDGMVFTAGMGENQPLIRQKCLEGLEFLGIEIDTEKNEGNETDIGRGKVRVLVIPTNEELVIAQDTQRLVQEHLANRAAATAEEAARGESPALDREQRAELVLLWAHDTNTSMDELREKLNAKLGTSFPTAAITRELEVLGLT